MSVHDEVTVAFADENEIARRDLAHGNAPFAFGPQNARRRRSQRAKRSQRPFVARLLHDHEAHGQHRAADKQSAFADIAKHEVERRGRQQHGEHRLGQGRAHDGRKAALRRRVEFVETCACDPLARLCFGKRRRGRLRLCERRGRRLRRHVHRIL